MRVCSYNFKEKDKEEEFTFFFECDLDGNVINLPDDSDIDLNDGRYIYSGVTTGDISNESIERLIGDNGFVKLPSEYNITNLEPSQ